MNELKFDAAGVLGSGAVGALFLTTRVEQRGTEHFESFRSDRRPVIFTFWHGQLLPLVHVHRHEGIVVLVSEHGDGEYISRILLRHGFGTVRGSSTRGGIQGLKGLVRAARAGHDLALTPDGPRGPARRLKPGVLAAAQMTGLPIVPLAVGVSSGWRAGSWDGFLVPKPWSRVTVEYLPPRYVPRDASRADLAPIAERLEADLNVLSDRLAAESSGV